MKDASRREGASRTSCAPPHLHVPVHQTQTRRGGHCREDRAAIESVRSVLPDEVVPHDATRTVLPDASASLPTRQRLSGSPRLALLRRFRLRLQALHGRDTEISAYDATRGVDERNQQDGHQQLVTVIDGAHGQEE